MYLWISPPPKKKKKLMKIKSKILKIVNLLCFESASMCLLKSCEIFLIQNKKYIMYSSSQGNV